MKFHGIQVEEGSSIANLTVSNGTSFPSSPNEGEMFFRTDASIAVKGLYCYIGGSWDRIASSDSLTAPAGSTLPSAANAGDLYYLNSNDSSEGLYAYTGTAWVVVGASGSYTVTGDITGTIDGGTDVLTLATVNSNVGTYGDAQKVPALTVNAKGLVTAATTINISIDAAQVSAGTFDDARIAQSSVTQHQAALTLSAGQTTSGTFADARIAESNVTQHQAALNLSGSQIVSGSIPDARIAQSSVTQHQAALTIGESQITNSTILARVGDAETITGNWTYNNPVISAEPTAASHLTTKNYVDNAIAGLTWKRSVKVATTANITLSGLQTIDGVSVTAGSRVLVKNQTNQAQNGVYVVASGAWTRSTDFDSVSPIDEINSAAIFVEQGSTQSDTGWTQSSQVTTIDTDPMTFVQFSAAGAYSAGAGLSLSGNVFNVGTASTSRIVVNVDTIDLAAFGPTLDSSSLVKFSTDGYGRVSDAIAIGTSDLTSLLDGTYVNVGGDTMTGVLTITPSSGSSYTIYDTAAPQNRGSLIRTASKNRWLIGANTSTETGSGNTGSDFQIIRFDDAGTQIDTPFQITRSSGLISSASSWYISRNTPVVSLNTAGSGQTIQLDFRTANAVRWAVQKNNVAESGSNAGSNFIIYRYDDAGTLIDAPLQISRATGLTSLTSLSVSGALSSTGTVSISSSQNLSFSEGSESIVNLFRQSGTAATVLANGMKYTGTANGFASSYSSSWARSAIVLGGPSAGNISFYTNTASVVAAGTDVTPTERMRIDTGGNIGIGTGSPSLISGYVNVDSRGSTGSFYYSGTTATAQGRIGYNGSVGSYEVNAVTSIPLTFATNSSERMRIDTSGNFGIGTTSPSSFNIQGAPIFALSGSGATFVLNDTAASSRWALLGRTGASTNQFRIYDGVATTDRLVIDSAGSVGIGTSAPESRFDVAGSAPVMTLRSSAAGAAEFNLRGNGQPVGQALYIAHDASQNAYFWNRSNAAILFGSNNTERMRIDASGNVGIGGTPNSNGAGWSTLTVNGSTGGVLEFNSAGTRNAQILGNTSELRLAAIASTAYINMQTGGVADRMRITYQGYIGMGGNLTGTAAALQHQVAINYAGGGSTYGLALKQATNTTTAISFVNGADSVIGTITTTASATAYNTTSDARVKENIADAESASALIDSIQVRQYDWKATGEHQRYGMVAQELKEVVPEAVHSPADPEQLMAVDYSKLVPLLVKEIQELRARVAALESQ